MTLAPWRTVRDAFRLPPAAIGRLGFPRRDDTGTSPDGYRTRDLRSIDLPSFAVTEKARSWSLRLNGAEPRQVLGWELLALQTFPPRAIITGTRTARFLQVANAIPPLLAAHVAAEASGHQTGEPMPDALIRDDYAGPGGWSHGLALLGLSDVGIEWDAHACATRAANGLTTIRADLATYRPGGRPWGYIASPPCQTFSTAGKGAGRPLIGTLVDMIARRSWVEADTLDPRTRHVIDTARNALTLGSEWVALEQVPAVLPVWEAVADELRREGYSVWTGNLNAADYGVPQTRRRAILIASRTRTIGRPPATHAEHPDKVTDLFTERPAPWVSMATALGIPDTLGEIVSGQTIAGGRYARRPITAPAFTATQRSDLWRLIVDRRQTGAPLVDGTERPAPTITAQAFAKGIWRVTFRVNKLPNATRRTLDQPAPTITSGHSVSSELGPYNGDELVLKLEPAHVGILQSFPPGWAWQGSRPRQYLQVGNAIPPRLGAHILAELTGKRRVLSIVLDRLAAATAVDYIGAPA